MPRLLVDDDPNALSQWAALVGTASQHQPSLMRRIEKWWDKLPPALRTVLLSFGLDAFFDQLSDILFENSREAQRELSGDLIGVATSALPPAPGPLVDTATLRAEEWARNEAATMVADINATQEAAIREAVVSSLEQGGGMTDLADRLLNTTVGLTPQYHRAVDNQRATMVANGIPRGIANRRAAEYAERLRRERMSLIARTETFKAMNQGRLVLWQAAVLSGDLPPDTTKQWVTAQDERVCPTCAPLDAVEAPLSMDFRSFSRHGDASAPPLHPNCRCLVMLTSPRAVERSNIWRRLRDLEPIEQR